MDLLIRLSANVDGIEAPGIDSPGSPLFLSCYQQHNNVTRRLVEAHADVCRPNAQGSASVSDLPLSRDVATRRRGGEASRFLDIYTAHTAHSRTTSPGTCTIARETTRSEGKHRPYLHVV